MEDQFLATASGRDDQAHLNLSLVMPRDAVSVPMVRHLCGQALREIGATEDCVDSVELAITEACSNVVLHAKEGNMYRVEAMIGESECEVCVVDYAPGLQPSDSESATSPTSTQGFEKDLAATSRSSDESGRGLPIMSALMDKVSFLNKPASGALIHLVKKIEYTTRSKASRPLRGSIRGSAQQ